jgi:hypothetical protein
MLRVSSECATPYARQEGVVGEGLRREQNEADSDGGQGEGLSPDVTEGEDGLPENELERALARLKKSIARGKPGPT